jgi:hypothetical protein
LLNSFFTEVFFELMAVVTCVLCFLLNCFSLWSLFNDNLLLLLLLLFLYIHIYKDLFVYLITTNSYRTVNSKFFKKNKEFFIKLVTLVIFY